MFLKVNITNIHHMSVSWQRLVQMPLMNFISDSGVDDLGREVVHSCVEFLAHSSVLELWLGEGHAFYTQWRHDYTCMYRIVRIWSYFHYRTIEWFSPNNENIHRQNKTQELLNCSQWISECTLMDCCRGITRATRLKEPWLRARNERILVISLMAANRTLALVGIWFQ